MEPHFSAPCVEDWGETTLGTRVCNKRLSQPCPSIGKRLRAYSVYPAAFFYQIATGQTGRRANKLLDIPVNNVLREFACNRRFN